MASSLVLVNFTPSSARGTILLIQFGYTVATPRKALRRAGVVDGVFGEVVLVTEVQLAGDAAGQLDWSDSEPVGKADARQAKQSKGTSVLCPCSPTLSEQRWTKLQSHAGISAGMKASKMKQQVKARKTSRASAKARPRSRASKPRK